MSHILEHCPNVELALREVRRVLKEGGQLFVFVPPHDNYICAGHVSMGWNVGQLLYVLLLAGFQVRDGKFLFDHSGSVCGFVRKNSALVLPPLRGDRGDIRILGDAGLFPLPIISREAAETEGVSDVPYLRSSDDFNDGFWGNIDAINWPVELANKSTKRRLAKQLSLLIPRRARTRLGNYIAKAGKLLLE